MLWYDFTVQGPMALQNTTSPTGAIVATGPVTFSIGFDQEVNFTFILCTVVILNCIIYPYLDWQAHSELLHQDLRKHWSTGSDR